MAWEWVPTTAAAAVGIAGMAFTYWSGQRQVQASRQLAERQARLALLTQREERQQRRLEAAYPVLLDAVTEGGLWVSRVDAYFRHENAGSGSPPLPPAAERLEQQGSLSAVWSPQVASLVREWSLGANEVRLADARRRIHGLSSTHGEDDGLEGRATRADELYESFRVGRDQMLLAEQRLREQVWKELRVESGGHAELERSAGPVD